MRKEGDEDLSYIVGAFSNVIRATLLGKIEEMSLSSQYKFEIIEIESFDQESVKINIFFKNKKSSDMTNLIVKHYKEDFKAEGMVMGSLHLAVSDHIELLSDELQEIQKKINIFSKEEQKILSSMLHS